MSSIASAWRSLARVLLFLVSCAVLLAVTAAFTGGEERSIQAVITGVTASVGCLVLTVQFARWDGLRIQDVGAMPERGSLVRLAVGFACGLLLVALHCFVVSVAGHTRWMPVVRPSAPQASLIAFGYLLLAAREELAFHGYPLRRLHVLLGVWGAQATIAAAFALEHIAGGWSPAQALWGAAMGSLLFGMASIATRGLAIPIGIHAAWNFGDWLRGNRPEPGMWHPVIDSGYESAASAAGTWAYVAIMAAATMCFWFWHRGQKPSQTSEPSPVRLRGGQ